MSGALAYILERYGQPVTVCGPGTQTACRAFLQPTRQEKRQELPTPLGQVRQDQWLYLGDPAVPLDPQDGYVEWNGLQFDVRTAQPIYVGSQLSHWWAVLAVRDAESETL